VEQQSAVADSSIPFSGGRFILGLIVALFVGAIADFFAGLTAASVKIQPLGFVIGAVPGLILGAIGLWRRRRGGFGEGLLVGACVILLIGSLCGGAMGGGLDFK